MKGQWGLILAISLALIIAVFSVMNVESVTFHYIFGETQWPLILIIIVSALMGALFTGLLGMVKVFRLQKQVKRLEKELSDPHSRNGEDSTLHIDGNHRRE
ncbi:MAG: LapA family protein [Tuberibacillus sp.]